MVDAFSNSVLLSTFGFNVGRLRVGVACSVVVVLFRADRVNDYMALLLS